MKYTRWQYFSEFMVLTSSRKTRVRARQCVLCMRRGPLGTLSLDMRNCLFRPETGELHSWYRASIVPCICVSNKPRVRVFVRCNQCWCEQPQPHRVCSHMCSGLFASVCSDRTLSFAPMKSARCTRTTKCIAACDLELESRAFTVRS
jgi:hypothetical protein